MKKTFKEFLAEKGLEMDAVKNMTAEKSAELYNEFNAVNQKALEDAIEAKASKEDIEGIKAELKSAQEEQFQDLNSKLVKLGVSISKSVRPAGEGTSKKSISEQLKEGLEANIENLKTMKDASVSEAKAAAFEMEVKAPATMLLSTNVSGGNIPVEDRIDGLNLIPSRRIRLLDVMAQRSTTSNVISWVYQANKDGAAGQTAEGATKNQIDYDLVVASENVKKSTAFIKVSTEMLDDIEWIQSEIEGELMRELLKVVESQAYSGDGTGQNHNGIRTVAPAFAAGSFAGTVDNANELDVLTVAHNQIMVAQEGEAMPNYIFVHPNTVTKMKLIKRSATDREYVDKVYDAGSFLIVDGIPVIPTTLVTDGEYLIGDFGFSLLVTRTGMRFDIGLDGDDFTKNLRTILAEWRGCTIVKNNDRSAFVKGVFATDKAALETP